MKKYSLTVMTYTTNYEIEIKSDRFNTTNGIYWFYNLGHLIACYPNR